MSHLLLRRRRIDPKKQNLSFLQSGRRVKKGTRRRERLRENKEETESSVPSPFLIFLFFLLSLLHSSGTDRTAAAFLLRGKSAHTGSNTCYLLWMASRCLLTSSGWGVSIPICNLTSQALSSIPSSPSIISLLALYHISPPSLSFLFSLSLCRLSSASPSIVSLFSLYRLFFIYLPTISPSSITIRSFHVFSFNFPSSLLSATSSVSFYHLFLYLALFSSCITSLLFLYHLCSRGLSIRGSLRRPIISPASISVALSVTQRLSRCPSFSLLPLFSASVIRLFFSVYLPSLPCVFSSPLYLYLSLCIVLTSEGDSADYHRAEQQSKI